MPVKENLLESADVAARWSVSVRYVRQLVHDGVLRARRLPVSKAARTRRRPGAVPRPRVRFELAEVERVERRDMR